MPLLVNLQEACLSAFIKPSIWNRLRPGQSGYTKGRSPYDPHLLLFELARMYLDCRRCLWIVMGDFKKAYPRVWRTDLLDLMAMVPEAGVGMLACGSGHNKALTHWKIHGCRAVGNISETENLCFLVFGNVCIILSNVCRKYFMLFMSLRFKISNNFVSG